MNFAIHNFCLIVLFFIDSLWSTYTFNGSSTNCDDSEIEKYFIPGQTFPEDPIWKENVKIAVI